jgi:hypothetical protein
VPTGIPVPFSYVSGNCAFSGNTLAVGSLCTVNILFAPTTPGAAGPLTLPGSAFFTGGAPPITVNGTGI